MVKVWAACKDPGGTNGILPIVKKLRENGHIVDIIADGNALKRLPVLGLDFLTPSDAITSKEKPDIFITSMCSGGGIGRDLVPKMKNDGIPTVALQDNWGVRLLDEWANKKYWPDYIFVNDLLGKKIVSKAWPNFNKKNIIITGFPMFDSYSLISSADRRDARTCLLKGTGWPDDASIIFFACGVLDGATELLKEVLYALGNTVSKNRKIKLIARSHPQLEDVSPRELISWNKTLKSFGNSFPEVIARAEDASALASMNIKELLLSSDVVISDFSTVTLEASLVGAKLKGKDIISAYYTKKAIKEFQTAFRGLVREPILVTRKCSSKAKDRDSLINLINKSLSSGLNLGKAQKSNFYPDGKNSKRAADFIELLA